MHKHLLLYPLVVLIYACTAIDAGSYISNESQIERVQSDAWSHIEYESYDYLASKLSAKAKNALWSPDRLKRELKLLPPGGQVVAKVSSVTIESANTKYWEFVVTDLDGKEMQRRTGSNSIANHNTGKYSTEWWNIAVVRLHSPVNVPFKFHVIDNISDKRSTYIVYPNTNSSAE